MISAVPRIVELLTSAPARAGRTRILAIEGPSGAGKTTLSREVQAALGPGPIPGPPVTERPPPTAGARPTGTSPPPGVPPIVQLEDFYPGWDGLDDVVPRLVEWVLEPLARGEQAGYRRYDWERHEYAEWHDVPPSPLLIVEGVGAGALPGMRYLSALVYVDAPEPLRFERAMARDGDTYRPHWERWAEQERRFFARDDPRSRADMVLGGA